MRYVNPLVLGSSPSPVTARKIGALPPMTQSPRPPSDDGLAPLAGSDREVVRVRAAGSGGRGRPISRPVRARVGRATAWLLAASFLLLGLPATSAQGMHRMARADSCCDPTSPNDAGPCEVGLERVEVPPGHGVKARPAAPSRLPAGFHWLTPRVDRSPAAGQAGGPRSGHFLADGRRLLPWLRLLVC